MAAASSIDLLRIPFGDRDSASCAVLITSFAIAWYSFAVRFSAVGATFSANRTASCSMMTNASARTEKRPLATFFPTVPTTTPTPKPTVSAVIASGICAFVSL